MITIKAPEFKSLVKRILKEELEQSVTDKTIFKRVPEVVHGEDYKKITPHPRDTKSKFDLLEDMDKLVKGINKNYMVIWDDHDDISINAKDLFRIRIIPRWENSYHIEAYTRNEDRLYITGQTWDQVKEFVEENLKSVEPHTEIAYNKSLGNYKDKTDKAVKELSQKDKPKTLPLTNEPVKKTENKDKNYTEDQVKKDDDLPEKPMRELKDVKKQRDYKVNNPNALTKKFKESNLIAKRKSGD
jgi:hypothetical protein